MNFGTFLFVNLQMSVHTAFNFSKIQAAKPVNKMFQTIKIQYTKIGCLYISS